jgi:hypothetical protein
MARWWVTVLYPLSAVLLVSHSVAAQDPGRARVRLGASVGTDALPAPLRLSASCASDRGSDLGVQGGWVASLRASVRLRGRVGLEGRAAVHSGASYECANANAADAGIPVPIPSPRPLVWERSAAASKAYRSLDARLRVDLDHEDRAVFAVGPGILLDGPFYWSGSLRYLWGRTKRVGAELEVQALHTPWTKDEGAVYPDPANPSQLLYTLLRSTTFKRWQTGVALSVVFEMPS